jgi:hypothetical protein
VLFTISKRFRSTSGDYIATTIGLVRPQRHKLSPKSLQDHRSKPLAQKSLMAKLNQQTLLIQLLNYFDTHSATIIRVFGGVGSCKEGCCIGFTLIARIASQKESSSLALSIQTVAPLYENTNYIFRGCFFTFPSFEPHP